MKTQNNMKNIASGVRGLVIIIVFVVGLHSYFGCGDAAAAEKEQTKSAKVEKKAPELTIEEKVAAKEAELEKLFKQNKAKRDKLLETYQSVEVDLDLRKKADLANISIAASRYNSILQQNRIYLHENAGGPKEVRSERFKRLGEDNDVALMVMIRTFVAEHENRYDRARNVNKTEYAKKEAKLIADYDKQREAVKAEKAALEKTWSYRWVRCKRWTGSKYDSVAGWFGSDEKDKKEKAQVAKK